MRALVLAAGIGSRLHRYTDDRPKPMLEIAGEPILGYNLAMLASGGFDDVVVNLHYLGDVIRAYIGDGSRWGVRVTYSEEPELRGTAGALIPLAPRLAETFGIVYGDNLNDLDLADMVRSHHERRALATIAVWSREDVAQSGVAEVDADDRIVRFVEKPAPGETPSHLVSAGVVVAEPSLLDAIPRERPSDLGRDIFPLVLNDAGGLHAYRIRAGHWWFDRIEEYEAAAADPRLAAFLHRVRVP